jgi:hypothetical protein
MSYGIDMTPLMNEVNLNPAEFVQGFVQRFALDIQERVGRLAGQY